MIIDSHLHLRDDVFVGAEGSPENIVRLMDQVGIDKSVVFRIWCTTDASIKAGEEAARKYPDRLIPYAYAVPSYERPVLGELDAALSAGAFRGVKVHAGDARLAGYIIDPVLELAAKHDVPCLVDYRGDDADAERMAKEFPKLKIIAAHLGKYLCTEEEVIDRFIALAERYDNVFLDVSGVVLPHKIRDAAKRVGSGRVMWGTDGPRKTPDTPDFARMELAKVRALRLDESEKEDILGRTAAGLLNL